MVKGLSMETPVPDSAPWPWRFAQVKSLAVRSTQKRPSCFWQCRFINKPDRSDQWIHKDIAFIAYRITYVETQVPAAAGTFHAQYRRARTGERNPYVILDGVKGRGHYVGIFLA